MFVPKSDEVVGYVIYTLAKLGYSRPEIEKVSKELRNTFKLKCTNQTFDLNLTSGRIDRKNLLPTIDKQEGKK